MAASGGRRNPAGSEPGGLEVGAATLSAPEAAGGSGRGLPHPPTAAEGPQALMLAVTQPMRLGPSTTASCAGVPVSVTEAPD